MVPCEVRGGNGGKRRPYGSTGGATVTKGVESGGVKADGVVATKDRAGEVDAT